MSTKIQSMTIHDQAGTGRWLVQIENAVGSATGEEVSFVVSLPRSPGATVPRLQRDAAARAIELLQPLADRPIPD